MLYYVKRAFFPFLYLFFMFIIGLGIMSISGLTWLKYILAVLNAGIYFLVAGAAAYKDGQDALKVRVANDTMRREIIRTGEDKPLKLHEEYKWYKGGLIALTACIPMFALLLVQGIFNVAGVENATCGLIATFIYYVEFIFFRIAELSISNWGYFLLLLFPAVFVPIDGVCYYLGAKKLERQQQMIQDGIKKAYGKER